MTYVPYTPRPSFPLTGSLTANIDRIAVICDNNPEVNARVKVAVYDLETKENYSHNGKNAGWAASIIKVPVLVAALRAIEEGTLSPLERLSVDHKFKLEEGDAISRMPEGTRVSVYDLCEQMIVNSDNEATNMIANRVGVEQVNDTMWSLGMRNSMLGHLLCPKMPRYTSEFNPDGSNITCPRDMLRLMRHLYDPRYSSLSARVRDWADIFMEKTVMTNLYQSELSFSKIKSKVGMISDPIDGADIHDVGVIDDRFLYCVMMNRIDPMTPNEFFPRAKFSQSWRRARKPRTPTGPIYRAFSRAFAVQLYGETMDDLCPYAEEKDS